MKKNIYGNLIRFTCSGLLDNYLNDCNKADGTDNDARHGRLLATIRLTPS
jgi:hypothetical protein